MEELAMSTGKGKKQKKTKPKVKYGYNTKTDLWGWQVLGENNRYRWTYKDPNLQKMKWFGE